MAAIETGLSKGLMVAGDVTDQGLTPWPEQGAAAVARIRAAWWALGTEVPHWDLVAWFDITDDGTAYVEQHRSRAELSMTGGDPRSSVTDVRALLWAGIEGESPLWEAAWELRSLHPEGPDSALRDRARQILEELLRRRHAELYRQDGLNGPSVLLPAAEAGRVLHDDRWWEPAAWDDEFIVFEATEAGRRFYDTEPGERARRR
ncbi:hypothetical protein KG112_14210 [Nocardioides sp. zg-ZUI104]|nr:hypothetical protein [Nocardioides faecalis]